jgi:hypothetical protein
LYGGEAVAWSIINPTDDSLAGKRQKLEEEDNLELRLDRGAKAGKYS